MDLHHHVLAQHLRTRFPRGAVEVECDCKGKGPPPNGSGLGGSGEGTAAELEPTYADEPDEIR